MLVTCGIIFPGGSGQQQWAELLASPEIMRVNNWRTYIHSVLVQPFCFFTFSVCVLNSCSCFWLFEIVWTVATRLLCPWDSPGKNTGVWCCALLQGIFLIQASNLHLLCLCFNQQILYPLEPPWKPHFQYSTQSIIWDFQHLNIK